MPHSCINRRVSLLIKPRNQKKPARPGGFTCEHGFLPPPLILIHHPRLSDVTL